MADIIFYEKPGCINNARQKKILREAGHKVDARNLLTEPWTAARLLAFFNGLPVDAWFNQSAPAVKSGEINPDALSAEQAIRCMLGNPLLIRRPLMEIGFRKIVGFEARQVSDLIYETSVLRDDMEVCPESNTESK